MSETVALDGLERDALTEIVNIGVGRAAVSLRKMVGAQVLLSVPAVEVVTREGAARVLGEREHQELMAVRQGFEGAFSGEAMLIFPLANSLELVRAVAGGDLTEAEVAELEQEALAETGNVILNGCLASIANMLQRPLTFTLPRVLRGDSDRLFESNGSLRQSLVLFLYIDFSVRSRDIRGYIAMLMDLPSLAMLRQLINTFIAAAAGDEEVEGLGR